MTEDRGNEPVLMKPDPLQDFILRYETVGARPDEVTEKELELLVEEAERAHFYKDVIDATLAYCVQKTGDLPEAEKRTDAQAATNAAYSDVIDYILLDWLSK